jgi:hypothetical protein
MEEITVPRAALVEALLDQTSICGPTWSAGYAVWVTPDGKATVAERGGRAAIRLPLYRFLAVRGGIALVLWSSEDEKANARAWIEANLAERVGEVRVRYE